MVCDGVCVCVCVCVFQTTEFQFCNLTLLLFLVQRCRSCTVLATKNFICATPSRRMILIRSSRPSSASEKGRIVRRRARTITIARAASTGRRSRANAARNLTISHHRRHHPHPHPHHRCQHLPHMGELFMSGALFLLTLWTRQLANTTNLCTTTTASRSSLYGISQLLTPVMHSSSSVTSSFVYRQTSWQSC